MTTWPIVFRQISENDFEILFYWKSYDFVENFVLDKKKAIMTKLDEVLWSNERMFFFQENPLTFRGSSGHVECSCDKPAWIFLLKLLKKFAKTTLPNILFWKLPGTFSLKRSSGHENHFWQPGRTCPPNPEKFSPKSKKKLYKTWPSKENGFAQMVFWTRRS